MKTLRLPLRRRPDPVLTEDELHVLRKLCNEYIASAQREMAKGPVSESVIRARMDAEAARAKISEVLRS